MQDFYRIFQNLFQEILQGFIKKLVMPLRIITEIHQRFQAQISYEIHQNCSFSFFMKSTKNFTPILFMRLLHELLLQLQRGLQIFSSISPGHFFRSVKVFSQWFYLKLLYNFFNNFLTIFQNISENNSLKDFDDIVQNSFKNILK